MTNTRFLTFAALACCSHTVIAASSDLAGTFRGEEQLTVSKCIDKTSSSPWQATFIVNGDQYTGEGTSGDGGKFQLKGEVLDGNGEGIVEGRTPEGRLWEGKTVSSVSSDGELIMQVDGTVPMAGCGIAVKIKAKKDGA